MEHEQSEAEGHRPPPNLGPVVTDEPPVWSTLPFTGSPNLAFAVSSAAGITSAGNSPAGPPPPLSMPTTGLDSPSGYLSPTPSLDDFLVHYEHFELTTDLLMIGHLPLNISHRDFCDTMDSIQRQLSVSTINNFYSTAEYGLGFQPSAGASWANDGFTYPNEQHCTYFLRLAGALPFGYTGQLDEEIRPTVFTAWVSHSDPHKTPRQLIIQPVPHDFRSSLLRPPVAVWRGIGTEPRGGGGGPAAALALVTLYVQQAAAERKRQDPNQDWHYHSFLSFHQVTVKPPPKPPQQPEQRRRSRDRSRSRTNSGSRPSADPTPLTPVGPVQVQYLELFILTVCSAPASDIDNCFAGLIPPPAPFNLPCFPIRLCGWWLEMASGLDPFISNGPKIGPSLELLLPCPTARINGLKPGATVSNIMRALATEGQDHKRLLGGYLDRPPDGGDSCVLLTDGKRLTGTFALRTWSPSILLTLADDNTDLRRLRERYQIFRRSLGLPLTPPVYPVASSTPPECGTITRLGPGPGNPTYCEIARTPTQPEGDATALAVTTFRHQLAQMNASINNRFAALEAQHDTQVRQVVRLTAEQSELRQGLRDTNVGLDAVQAVVEVHSKSHQDIVAFMSSQSLFLADHERRMKSIESHMQTLAKRRSPDGGHSPRGTDSSEQDD